MLVSLIHSGIHKKMGTNEVLRTAVRGRSLVLGGGVPPQTMHMLWPPWPQKEQQISIFENSLVGCFQK